MMRLETHLSISGLEQLTLGDFWSWAYSDLLSNVNRSTFAEFLVAAALDLLDTPRVEWDAVDLRYRDKGIEVKASAYLQSWNQARPSTIRFDIAKKQAWDAQTNTYASEPTRSADCYVFCLYPETDPARADVLDVAAWEFFVLPTAQIDRELDDQRSVGLRRVQSMCDAVDHSSLKKRVFAVLEISEPAELATDSLRKLATRTGMETVVLPGGAELQIQKWAIHFPPADPDRLAPGMLARTYTSKPLIDVDGEPLFGELAIVRWLQKDGWDAVWVDTYHDKGRHKLFWQGLPDMTSPYDLTQAPQAWDIYQRIVECNGGRAAGFFDVLAWRGTEQLFIEYKGPGDRRNDNELTWLEAATGAGVRERDLLYIVHS